MATKLKMIKMKITRKSRIYKTIHQNVSYFLLPGEKKSLSFKIS